MYGREFHEWKEQDQARQRNRYFIQQLESAAADRVAMAVENVREANSMLLLARRRKQAWVPTDTSTPTR